MIVTVRHNGSESNHSIKICCLIFFAAVLVFMAFQCHGNKVVKL